MPTFQVNALLGRAAKLLQDDISNIRWPLAELLTWLNDGQREIVLHKPNASVKNTAFNLVADTKQALPADAIQLLSVMRNLPRGRSIERADIIILNQQSPDWHSEPPTVVVKHFCYSVWDLKNFYVYPPNNGTGVVELVYSASPADAVENGVISLDDIYQTVLLDYILYRAWSKDAEYASNPQRANAHYMAFGNALGVKLQMEKASSGTATGSGNPNLIK